MVPVLQRVLGNRCIAIWKSCITIISIVHTFNFSGIILIMLCYKITCNAIRKINVTISASITFFTSKIGLTLLTFVTTKIGLTLTYPSIMALQGI